MTGFDYFEKLRRDLLEQFKGKKNIEVFQKTLARQLDEVYEFYNDLNTLRWLKTAEGKQLDGIGDIVVLSRKDALAIARLSAQNAPMDDEIYRLYLTWKIALNTSNCTHSDRHKALRLFWDETPLIYSENPAYPATIFITVPRIITGSETAVFNIAAMIKAAGVAIHFLFPYDEYTVTDYSGGAIFDLISEFIIEEVENTTDTVSYDAGAIAELIDEFITEEVETITDAITYNAGAIYEVINDFIVEPTNTETQTKSYDARAIFELVSEFITEG